VEALKRTLRLCSDWGIGTLTAYAFSTENWNRPGEEVSFLMTLFERVLARELQGLDRERVRIRFLGDLTPLPPGLQRLIAEATARTAGNTGIRFNVCTNYGGRAELVGAARRLAEQVARGELLLDGVLAGQQPIHGGIQVVLGGLSHAEVLGQARAVPAPGGGQLGVGLHDARGHHGQHPVAFTAGLGSDYRGQAQTERV
jgi:hypothetical protein